MSAPAPCLTNASEPPSEPTSEAATEPTVSVAAEAVVTAPRPLSREIVRALPSRLRVAPEAKASEATDGRAEAAPRRRVPAATSMPPACADTAESVSAPEPVLRQTPEPARPEAKVTSFAPTSSVATTPVGTAARRAERSVVLTPDQRREESAAKVTAPEPLAPETKASVPPTRRSPPLKVPAPARVSVPAPSLATPWEPAIAAPKERSPAVVSKPRKEPAEKLPLASADATSASVVAAPKASVAPEATDQRLAVPRPPRASPEATVSTPALTVVTPVKPAAEPASEKVPVPTLVRPPAPARPPLAEPAASSNVPAETVSAPSTEAPSKRTVPAPVLASAPAAVTAPGTVRVTPTGTSRVPPAAPIVSPRRADKAKEAVACRPPPTKFRLSASNALGTPPRAASIATDTRPPARMVPPR